ncbi:MAG: cisplatin damage response ATP-dependent DNA ligase, partial [Comamonadaceae bacterium]
TDTRARPDGAAFAQLVAAYSDADRQRGDGQPYPFFLAHPWSLPLADMDARLGPPDQWQIEWKWDGIRAQVVRRAGRVFIWSRGEELVTEQFPEISRMAQGLGEGVVLDGEIVVWEDDTVQPFARLQQRLGRKIVGPKVLADQPVVFLAYDLLEQAGQDCRALSQQARREKLVQVCAGVTDPVLRLSPVLTGATWAELAAQREQSRTLGVEGMMLKSVSAAYGVGRTKNDGVWWKWKVDPLSIDAVLIYAQRGHGRRASLYTDYTFALWDGPPEMKDRRLVPVAKAYSGLTDEEIRQVDAIIRRTTVEKFGPVRSVKPALVFELGFEGIARSSRHKSGVALRFPRMLRWRQDKPIDQADSVDGLAVWLPA